VSGYILKPLSVEWFKRIELQMVPDDKIEMQYAMDESVHDCLSFSLSVCPDAQVGLYRDKLLCVFGCRDIVPGVVGLPWLLTCFYFKEYPIAVGRAVRDILFGKWMKRYEVLYNHVHAENSLAIGWLQEIGFTVEEKAEPYGLRMAPFRRFEWSKQ
jgi:hypothetical protein